jgi:hypothetical protein
MATVPQAYRFSTNGVTGTGNQQPVGQPKLTKDLGVSVTPIYPEIPKDPLPKLGPGSATSVMQQALSARPLPVPEPPTKRKEQPPRWLTKNT